MAFLTSSSSQWPSISTKEKVFPVLTFRGAALDLAHAQLKPIERLDGGVKSTDSILNAEHQGGLVLPVRGQVSCEMTRNRVVLFGLSWIDRSRISSPYTSAAIAPARAAAPGLSRRKFSRFRGARDFNPFQVVGIDCSHFRHWPKTWG